jgi:uncharacterized protein (DUF58 family)
VLKEDLLKKIKRIQIVSKKTVDSLFGGEYQSVFKGQGIHFADFREYQTGDDIRHIAWNLSARNNNTYIKTFEEERELNVFLIVDISASQIYSSFDLRKIDLSSQIASLIAYSAIINKDRIGMLSFSDTVNEFVPPKKGKKHVLSLITRILNIKKLNNKTNIKEALNFISKVLKKRSVLFIISDFIFSEDIENILKKLALKHDLVALCVYDEKEYEMPNIGLLKIKDPETGNEQLVDTGSYVFRTNYQKNIKKHINNLEELFKHAKVDFLKIKTSEDYINILFQYFKTRKKRARR